MELLRSLASRKLLNWVRVFIADPDPGIASWGMGIVDALVFSEEISPGEAESLILLGESHSDADVQEASARVREVIDFARRPSATNEDG